MLFMVQIAGIVTILVFKDDVSSTMIFSTIDLLLIGFYFQYEKDVFNSVVALAYTLHPNIPYSMYF